MNSRITKILSLLCDEPYRIFFPLGVIFGMAGVGHWLFYSFGWLKSYSGFYHSSVQMLVYMSSFVAGFLLTAMPRFAALPHATVGELLTFLILIVGIFVFLTLGHFIAGEICFIIWLLMLGRFGISRITKKREATANPPVEMIWIPIAILHGVTGTLLLILGQLKLVAPWLIVVGKPMMEQGFLLSIVLGVGGFLIPRLMGTYKVSTSAEPCLMDETSRLKRRNIPFHLTMGALLFLSFWLEGLGKEVFGYGLRALVVTSECVKNGLLPRPPRVSDLFVRLIWFSVWMINVGFWAVAFLPSYRVAMLHLVFIGGFSLLTFVIATMVVISHAGEGERLHRPLWIFGVIAVGLMLTLSKRLAVVFFPDFYFNFLGISAALWIAVGVSWLCFVAPRIVKIPEADEFGRMHEEAKERMLNLVSGEKGS